MKAERTSKIQDVDHHLGMTLDLLSSQPPCKLGFTKPIRPHHKQPTVAGAARARTAADSGGPWCLGCLVRPSWICPCMDPYLNPSTYPPYIHIPLLPIRQLLYHRHLSVPLFPPPLLLPVPSNIRFLPTRVIPLVLLPDSTILVHHQTQ